MEMAQDQEGEKKGQVVSLQTLTLRSSLSPLDVWTTYSFAPEWFQDALYEARNGCDHHSRRREILFAVCAAESYILEWVRDEVLDRDFDQLKVYFPPGKRRGVKEKWKEIPKELHKDKKINNIPDWGGDEWQDLRKLVEYRDGLVHARASRPETASLSSDEKPLPSKIDLDKMPPGWAVQKLITLVRHLHGAIGTSTPVWLVDP